MGKDQTPPSLPAERIVSIDVFRGLTMLVMLFVNDIGDYGVHGRLGSSTTWPNCTMPIRRSRWTL